MFSIIFLSVYVSVYPCVPRVIKILVRILNYLSIVIAMILYVEDTENAQKNKRDSQRTHSKNPRIPTLLITLYGWLNKVANSETRETKKSRILYKTINTSSKKGHRIDSSRLNGWEILTMLNVVYCFHHSS